MRDGVADGQPPPDAADHRAMRELIGAHLLGQLDPDEDAGVSRHVQTCAECRAEVAELAPLVPWLTRLRPTGHTPGDGSTSEPTLIGSGDRPRRRRRAVAAVLVAASIVAAVGLGVALRPVLFPGVEARPVTLTVAPGIRADAGVVAHTWGTEFRLHASGLQRGVPYGIRFLTDAGRQVSAGSVIGTGSTALTCSLNSAVPIDDAHLVQVTDRQGTIVIEGDID